MIMKQLEEANLTNESTLSNIRKKQKDQTAAMSEQIEVLNRSKQKLEKEKSELKLEVAELNTNVDALTKGKLNYEKQSRNLEDAIAELRQKYEENNVTIAVMVFALLYK